MYVCMYVCMYVFQTHKTVVICEPKHWWSFPVPPPSLPPWPAINLHTHTRTIFTSFPSLPTSSPPTSHLPHTHLLVPSPYLSPFFPSFQLPLFPLLLPPHAPFPPLLSFASFTLLSFPQHTHLVFPFPLFPSLQFNPPPPPTTYTSCRSISLPLPLFPSYNSPPPPPTHTHTTYTSWCSISLSFTPLPFLPTLLNPIPPPPPPSQAVPGAIFICLLPSRGPAWQGVGSASVPLPLLRP